MLPKHLADEIYKRKMLNNLVFDSLPPSLRRTFERCAIIGDTLNVYFKHQAFKQEFESKKPQILEEMRRFYKERGLKDTFVFKSVCAQILHLPLKKEESKKREHLYKEQSTGNFVNDAQDPRLYSLFEEIRAQIKARKEEEEAEEAEHE